MSTPTLIFLQGYDQHQYLSSVANSLMEFKISISVTGRSTKIRVLTATDNYAAKLTVCSDSGIAPGETDALPEDFTFMVYHECAWGCKGIFMPSRYNSSRAKCIKCTICGIFFSPNKFIFHSHRIDINDKYTEPDAANFNSWRRHMKLLGNPSDDVIHSWEDVKAMFNGGTRKRISLNGQTKSGYDSSQNMRVLEKKNYKPVTHVPMTGLTSKYFETQRKVSSYSDITLKLTGRGVFDYVLDQNASYNEENFEKSHKYSVFTCLPWITKRNSIRLNCSTKSLCSGETGSPQIVSAFNDPINKSAFQPVISNSFDEMKIQTSVQSLKTSVPLQHKAEPIVTDDEIDVETIDIQLKKKHYSSDYLSSTKIVVQSKDIVRKRGLWSGVQLREAIQLIENENYSIRAAGIRLPVFDKEQESMLKDKVLKASDLYHGVTTRQCKSIAFNLAEKCQLPNPFNSTKRLAGDKWLRNFMGRNENLIIRKPESTSLQRIRGFTKEKVDIFFNNLKSVQSLNKIAPSRIYNLDETGITTVHSPPNILAKKGQKQVGKSTSGERGKITTVLCCVSATGIFHPPMFVFARKRSSPMLGRGAPEGSMVEISDNGWINEVLFFKYIKSLVASLHPQLKGKIPCESDNLEPALIVMDNHESHRSLEVIDYCKLHKVQVVTLPPHTSHRTQPLDITFFGPLKKKFNQVCDEFVQCDTGIMKPITLFDLCELFSKAYNEVAWPSKGINGFKSTGIHPLNRRIFHSTFKDEAEDSIDEQSEAEENEADEKALEENTVKELTTEEHEFEETAVAPNTSAIKTSDKSSIQIECSLNAGENNMVICASEVVPISQVIYIVNDSGQSDTVKHDTDVICDINDNFNSTKKMSSSLTTNDKESIIDETSNCTGIKTSENSDFASALAEQFQFSSKQSTAKAEINSPKNSNCSEVLTSSPVRKKIADKKIKKIEEEKLNKIKKEEQEILKKK
ncbi:hypothetical protein TKK_0010299 [Trichogramma kaykai]